MSAGVIYEDGDFSMPLRVSLPVLSAPIPGVNTQYLLTEDWVQYEANYTPLALNTAHTDSAYTAFLLVSENNFRDLGNGVVRWTRRYARVPASHSEPVQVSYQFIGLLTFDPLETVIRPPFTRAVPGVKVHDYFLAGTNTQTAMQSLQTANFVSEQLYYWPRTWAFPLPFEAQAVTSIWENTVPTAASYGTLVTNGGTIVAYPSQFERWEGNIIRREYTSIVAQ
jgi:hypothetical protein